MEITIGCIFKIQPIVLFYIMENMDINNIVEHLARDHTVEKICQKVGINENPQSLEDLAQNIYLQLLTKNPQKIIEMYNNGQINFFIAKVVMNNICSKTSPYHRTYRQKHQEIPKNI